MALNLPVHFVRHPKPGHEAVRHAIAVELMSVRRLMNNARRNARTAANDGSRVFWEAIADRYASTAHRLRMVAIATCHYVSSDTEVPASPAAPVPPGGSGPARREAREPAPV